jgi:acrylyl-CoA reductase (NADPH)
VVAVVIVFISDKLMRLNLRNMSSKIIITWYGACVVHEVINADLPITVMPFVVRGVSFRGFNSVMCPMPRWKAAWRRLATILSGDILARFSRVSSLKEFPQLAEDFLAGNIRGRTVVDVNA